jgi:putative ABC transport system ATP-binding protein
MSDAPTARPDALAIADLAFAYPGQREPLLDIPAFACAAGEQVLLAGKSGSGKSTLLNLIMGLLEPSAGTVRVAGRDLHKLSGAARDHYRGRHIGVVFQSFHLLHGFTALENVMMPLAFSDIPAREHDDRARGLLDELGIPRPGALPENLSIGQQQRVAVARALACEPELILADEPTASLDPENGVIAMDLIQGVCRTHDAAMLCVSHDPSLVDRFDRTLNLADLNRAAPAAAPSPGV